MFPTYWSHKNFSPFANHQSTRIDRNLLEPKPSQKNFNRNSMNEFSSWNYIIKQKQYSKERLQVFDLRQWWSIFNMHRLHTEQWCVRGGLGWIHFLHMLTASFTNLPCWYFQLRIIIPCTVWNHTNLRRISGWCECCHIIVEDNVHKQPVPKNDKHHCELWTLLPPERQPDPICDVNNGRRQQCHGRHEKLQQEIISYEWKHWVRAISSQLWIGNAPYRS